VARLDRGDEGFGIFGVRHRQAQKIGRRARKDNCAIWRSYKRTGKDGKSRKMPRKPKAAPLPSDPIQEPRDQGEEPGAPGLQPRQ
jgi:hypothetical protein